MEQTTNSQQDIDQAKYAQQLEGLRAAILAKIALAHGPEFANKMRPINVPFAKQKEFLDKLNQQQDQQQDQQ